MINVIRDTINNFPVGCVFAPADFSSDVSKRAAVNRMLKNMVVAVNPVGCPKAVFISLK